MRKLRSLERWGFVSLGGKGNREGTYFYDGFAADEMRAAADGYAAASVVFYFLAAFD